MRIQVVIVGAGGHGREVLEIMRTDSTDIELAGFIDDNPTLGGTLVDDLPVIGPVSWLENADRRKIQTICAIGNPLVSRRLCERIKYLGFSFCSAISAGARLSARAKIGSGVMIFPGVIVNAGAVIGDCSILNVGVTISHDSIVGSYANVNPGAHVAGNVRIGTGAFIGMGANLIQNLEIGEWSTIGAGAVVVRNIPPRVTAVGVPARILSPSQRK